MKVSVLQENRDKKIYQGLVEEYDRQCERATPANAGEEWETFRIQCLGVREMSVVCASSMAVRIHGEYRCRKIGGKGDESRGE